MEIEVRAQILDKDLFNQKFNNLNNLILEVENQKQKDTYFKHKDEIENQMVIRTRIEDNREILTFKWKSKDAWKDTSWPEFNTEIQNSWNLENLLLSCWYEHVCIIEKTRNTYKYENFEINIDSIKNLWDFIEIEIIIPDWSNQEDINNAKNSIIEVLLLNWVSKDEIIEKWYVQLVIQKNVSEK